MSAPTLQLTPQSETSSSYLPPTVAPLTMQSGGRAIDYASNNQASFGNAAVARVASQESLPQQQSFASNSEAIRSFQPNESQHEDSSPADNADFATSLAVQEDVETANQEQASATGRQSASTDHAMADSGVLSQDLISPAIRGIGKIAASPLGRLGSSQQAASAEDLFANFSFATASDIAAQLGVIGESLAGQFSSDRRSYVESSPSLSVSISKDAAAEALASKAGPVEALELPSAELVGLPPPGKTQPLSADESGIPAQPDGDSVGTSAGAPPQFRGDGEADATRMAPAADSARSTAQHAAQIIGSEISGNTTADRMVPVAVDRQEHIELPASTALPEATQSLEMLEYLQTDVGSDVRAIADSDFAPLLESSLAAPRSQVADAAKTRDIERQTAFDEAQAEADSASAAASTEQQQAIADGRALVETEKQKGLAEQQEELAKFDGEVSSRYQTQQEEIARTVVSEQTKADDAVAKGEADAREQEAIAKEEEARERNEREQNKPKKKKKKWHEKVGDWFKNAIKKWTDELVKAVKQVFDAAKTAVTKVLNEAKKLAIGIITVLRDTVVGMIKVFAEGLKLLVSGLLFAFPKLRDKVNAAIDGVVEKAIQIVDAVAKKLEETVVALIDRVQSTVNKILDLFELIIVTQIQIAGALLSGNFLDAAKILFLAACKAVGIPGEEFLDVLADAGDALMDIIKRPALFLRSMLKSVGQGMSVFFANFPARMMGGLTGWLFGQVAQGGISMIKSFDLKSIFMLLLQVMGFTYDYIRSRVVMLVGERAVETIEKVMEPIRILFTEGPGALWQWIGDQVEMVKNAIMEAASQWIVTQIITQAAIKIASMFTPVGAFVQAVLMMYNTIMFFVEKIKDIFAWVKSITSSFKTMAVGAVEAAANYIDQSMSKSIPLIIAFLARLLGIGGMGQKIREVVTKLRAPLDKGIDFVLGKIIELAKKAWGGIKAGAAAVKQSVSDWWNAKEEFRDESGETHHLYFESANDGSPRLTIASEPTDFDTYLQKLKDSGRIKEHDEIEPCYVPIRNAQATIKPGNKNDKPLEVSPDQLGRLAKKMDKSGRDVDQSERSIGEQLLAGAIFGDFEEDQTYWNMIGQAVVGFTAIGIAADLRDLLASIKKLFVDGKYGDIFEWANLVLIVIGFIPGLGDLVKLGGKSALKWMRSSGLVGRLIDMAISIIKKALSSSTEIVQKMLAIFKPALRKQTDLIQAKFQEDLFSRLSNYRPDFSDRIKTELASDHPAAPYTDLHVPGTKHETKIIDGDKQHRRHIVPYKQLRDELLVKLDGLTPREMAEVLGGMGFPPKSMDPEEIEKAAKDYLKWRNDDFNNLWVGSGRDNLRRGVDLDPEINSGEATISAGKQPRETSRLPGWYRRLNWSNKVAFSDLATTESRKLIPQGIGCYIF